MLEDNIQKQWYTIVVYPNRELKLRDRLRKLAKNEKYKNLIFNVIAPTFEERNDAGVIKEKLHYTQYLYFEAALDDKERLHNDAYHAVKIDGVRHILGDTDGPTPLRPEQVEKLLKSIEDGKVKDDAAE